MAPSTVKGAVNPLGALYPVAAASVWAPADNALVAWALDPDTVVDLSRVEPPRGLFVELAPGEMPVVPSAQVFFVTAVFFIQWLEKWALMEGAAQPKLSGAALPGFDKLLDHVKGWHARLSRKMLLKKFGIDVTTNTPTMKQFGICALVKENVGEIRKGVSSPVLCSAAGRREAKKAKK